MDARGLRIGLNGQSAERFCAPEADDLGATSGRSGLQEASLEVDSERCPEKDSAAESHHATTPAPVKARSPRGHHGHREDEELPRPCAIRFGHVIGDDRVPEGTSDLLRRTGRPTRSQRGSSAARWAGQRGWATRAHGRVGPIWNSLGSGSTPLTISIRATAAIERT